MPPEVFDLGAIFLRRPVAAEVGFLLHRLFWNQGFATMATRAVVEWALSNPSIWRVWATCDTENIASTRVLEKCDLVREGTMRRFAVRPALSPVPRDAFLYARVRGTDYRCAAKVDEVRCASA